MKVTVEVVPPVVQTEVPVDVIVKALLELEDSLAEEAMDTGLLSVQDVETATLVGEETGLLEIEVKTAPLEEDEEAEALG